jgi:hypothetical protein
LKGVEDDLHIASWRWGGFGLFGMYLTGESETRSSLSWVSALGGEWSVVEVNF